MLVAAPSPRVPPRPVRGARRGWSLCLALGAALLLPAPARGDWERDLRIAALDPARREALLRGVREAPQRALEALLREETEHLEQVRRAELPALQREAWQRLCSAGQEGGPLWRALAGALAHVGADAEALLRDVVREERARLEALPLRAANELIDQALRRALVGRVAALRDASLRLRREVAVAGPSARFSWKQVRGDSRLPTGLALPALTVLHQEAELRAALVGHELTSPWGRLHVEAASVEGLARAHAGTTTLTTAAGRPVEGLGVDFAVRARVTGLDAQVEGELAAGGADLGLRAELSARARAGAHAEAAARAVVSAGGAAGEASLAAGASAGVEVRIPLVLELVLVRARVVATASASIGVSGAARAALELEWTGRVRVEAALAASLGFGAGAGVTLELELGGPLRRALERLLQDPRGLVEELLERASGRTWEGPRRPGEAMVLTPEELAQALGEGIGPAPGELEPTEVAARFAPRIYQRLTHGAMDLIRAPDFDGDWNPDNDWEHLAGGDARAVVYWSLASTRTHWFVTYAWFHPRRAGTGPISGRPNDFHGCLVVARRGAPRGRELEAVLTADGATLQLLGGELATPGQFHGLAGEVRCVDEAGHPWLDLERTHAQLWVRGGDHGVVGFNGNDDSDPFSGEPGVTYGPGAEPRAPRGERDSVGFELRSLAEVLAHAQDPAFVDPASRRRLAGTDRDLPTRLRGGRGDASAAPPWAWAGSRETFHSRPESPGATDLLGGHTWSDPARTAGLMLNWRGRELAREYERRNGLPGLAGAVER
jgi:hypothetical protein